MFTIKHVVFCLNSGSTYDEDDHLTTSALPYTNDSTMLKENHPLMIMVSSGGYYKNSQGEGGGGR